MHIRFITIALLLLVQHTFSQSKRQQELEIRRQELRREIQQINSLLNQNKSQQMSQLTLMEDLNYKVSVRKNLIKVTNQQANLLTSEINNNQNKITNLRDELKTLKNNYAKMLVTAYKSKSEQSRVMFLLSSTNFKQAYKRIKYMNQYADYQKEQGLTIQEKTKQLQQINTQLLKQKKDKEQLIAENKKAQIVLEEELQQHSKLMAAINKDISKYATQIKNRQAEANRIDQEIGRIIKEAITSSNTKAGKTTTAAKKTSTYAMTPEDVVLANSFVSNKGKLPWPVEKGVVKLRYGTQPSPIVKTVMIQSNGVRIATEKNAKVRAVYNGEVYRIIASKKGNPSVLIRHGNYFTAYSNLAKIYVKKGDKVTTKQEIGEVFTNPTNGQTTLSFSVFKNAETQNPALWIYQM